MLKVNHAGLILILQETEASAGFIASQLLRSLSSITQTAYNKPTQFQQNVDYISQYFTFTELNTQILFK